MDTVVVGSGFGGSVTAARLAAGGHSVVVLERGRAYPPGSFARTPHEFGRALWDPSKGLLGLFDIWTFRGFSAIVSSGLGGGSLIYANVLLRKDENWFVLDDPDGGGTRPWPVSRADLDPHYDAVEKALGAQRFPLGMPGYETSGKTVAMRDAADRLGLDWQLPPLAVSFGPTAAPVRGAVIPEPAYGNLHGRVRTTCRMCGECDVGCNYGSKNTLDHTYLSAAVHHGADIQTGCEVRTFERTGRGWSVHYVHHDPAAEGRPRDTGARPVRTITCDRLVLAAGTLGTTYLLLRNRNSLPGISGMLGQRFSGNGDLLGFVLDAREPDGTARRLGSTAAPVITSTIRVPDELDGGTGRGFYLQDAGYPGFVDWLIEAASIPDLFDRAVSTLRTLFSARVLGRPRTEIGAQISALIGPGNRSSGATALLGMGRDVADGVMGLRHDLLDIDWTHKTSEFYFDRVRDTMHALADEWGGRFEQNPMSLVDQVITVHALGGVPMGQTPGDGVVNSYGEVFGQPGLFVVDGSVMPGPVGANPSLTIAAFADRAATAILDARTEPLARKRSRTNPPIRSSTAARNNVKEAARPRVRGAR